MNIGLFKPQEGVEVSGGSPGLRAWLVVESDPSGVLKAPAGQRAYLVDGTHAWDNVDGGTTWIPVEAGGGGAFIPLAQKGAANGVAELDATGKVPSSELPAVTGFIPTAQKGAVNGVAELDATGKVPASELPAVTGYIPTSEKGAASGVATLDAGGIVPFSQLPFMLGPYDFQRYFGGIGQLACGFAAPDFTLFYTNFMNRVLNDLNKSMELPIIAVNSGSSSWGIQSGSDAIGGVFNLHTGLNTYSTVVIRQWDSTSGSRLRSATPWYVAMRAKITNPGTHAILGFVLDDGFHKNIVLGYHGYLGTTNYVIIDDGGDVGKDWRDLGQAVDGNYHYLEMWTSGDGILHGRANGLLGGTVSMPFSTGSIQPGIRFGLTAESQDVGGANRQLWVDDLLVMLPKAPG
jgi:hypothetical protein